MKKWTFFLLLCITFTLFAQEEINLSANAIQGTFFNVFYPTYFDPTNPAGQPDLFSLTLQNTTTEEYPYQINFSMEWRGDELISNAKAFSLNNIQPNQTILIDSKSMLSEDEGYGSFYIDLSWEEILNSNSEFNDLIVNTGMFPDGVYRFTFQVINKITGDELSNIAYLTFTIRSTSSIQLITPGSPIGLGTSKVMDTHPYFVWFANFQNYTFRIWEVDDATYSSEQIEAMEPLLEESNINSTSYSYPIESNLEFGNIYAWQVLAEIKTPSQTNPTMQKSNVYLFEIARDQSNLNNNQLLIELLKQFSSSDVDGLEELIELLEKGYEMTEDDYHALLDKFSDGNKIKNVTIK